MISTEDKYTDTRIIQHNVCSLQYLAFWRVFEIAAHTLDPLAQEFTKQSGEIAENYRLNNTVGYILIVTKYISQLEH